MTEPPAISFLKALSTNKKTKASTKYNVFRKLLQAFVTPYMTDADVKDAMLAYDAAEQQTFRDAAAGYAKVGYDGKATDWDARAFRKWRKGVLKQLKKKDAGDALEELLEAVEDAAEAALQAVAGADDDDGAEMPALVDPKPVEKAFDKVLSTLSRALRDEYRIMKEAYKEQRAAADRAADGAADDASPELAFRADGQLVYDALAQAVVQSGSDHKLQAEQSNKARVAGASNAMFQTQPASKAFKFAEAEAMYVGDPAKGAKPVCDKTRKAADDKKSDAVSEAGGSKASKAASSSDASAAENGDVADAVKAKGASHKPAKKGSLATKKGNGDDDNDDDDKDDKDVAADDRTGKDARESVIGPDERWKVPKQLMRHMPFKAICKLEMDDGRGNSYMGTGWLASPSVVVTAGHCVHTGGVGGHWMRSIRVIPAMYGDGDEPFGSYMAASMVAMTPWLRRRSTRFDMGAILLETDVDFKGGDNEFITMRLDDSKVTRVTVCGYPGDLERGKYQYAMIGDIEKKQDGRLFYKIDTAGGVSGAPVLETHTSKAIGIHNYGIGGSDRFNNKASDLTAAFKQYVLNWR